MYLEEACVQKQAGVATARPSSLRSTLELGACRRQAERLPDEPETLR